MRTQITAAMVALTLASCGGNTENQETSQEKPAEKKAPVCTYDYDAASTQVQWIAYKYTEKAGVKGVFDNITVGGTKSNTNPAEVINGATFEIMTNSVNSGDATRDPKIKESFFGSLEGGDVISGNVVSVAGNETAGTAVFNVTMNGETKNVEGTYSVKGETLEAKVELNVEDWNGGDAIAKLNEVCSDLHKGADGSSKLWPDVTVFITTTLKKNCE